MPEGSKVSIRPDQIQQATGQKLRLRANADGKTFDIVGIDPQTFWSPMQPQVPQVQDPRFGAIGRQFDYLVGQNLLYIPRSEELIGFAQLRALADNLDILRLIIETRKDQMEALDWTIRARGDDKDKDVSDVMAFFEYPDKIHSYSEWMRMLLEDMFVIDALTVFPRLTNGGELYSLEPMDGSMIKPLLDASGRSPLPPSPAYQQILKGIPAVDYSRDDLIYKPRNVRTWKLYGFSPVEQIIFTVDTALRRNLFVKDYYREGSIPDAFGMVPDNWTPSQILEYQGYWDTLFENPTGQNSAQRRKMRWIPGAKDIKFAKEAILKDEFDEWLARICCYAFSVEPTPFIKQMNRGTGETQKEQSRMEGLLPLKKWWKSLMDFILTRHAKRPDVEFAWQDEDATDPLEAAQIDQIYVNIGAKLVNEVREDMGLDPIEGGDEPRMQTTEQTIAGAAPQGSGDGGGSAPSGQPPASNAAPAQPSAAEAEKSFDAGQLLTLFKAIYVHSGLSKGAADTEAEAIGAPEIVCHVDVPYVAGMSDDGKRCYLDSRLPSRIKDPDSGKIYDPRIAVVAHEMAEYLAWLDRKAEAPEYDDTLEDEKAPHGVGLRVEHVVVAAMDIKPRAHEKLMEPIEEACYNAAKAGEMKKIPGDLWRLPYQAEGEEFLLGSTEKLAKARTVKIGAPRVERRETMIQRQRMTRAIKRAFRAQADNLFEQLSRTLKLGKADEPGDDKDLDRMFDDVDWDAVWGEFPDVVRDPLQKTSADSVENSVNLIPQTARVGVAISKDFINTYASDYAASRAAEMVGKKWVDGALVDNPDARWVIADETRTGVRSLVKQAIDEGWSNDRLKQELRDAYVFSGDRAEKIARTETAYADSQGNVAGWKESGVVTGKQWLTAEDDLVSPECEANGAAGVVGLDDDFPSGDSAPPVHPNCLPGTSLVASVHRISAIAERRYDGDVVVICTAGGNRLSCTPNHPVLTDCGWIAARALNVGGHVVSCGVGKVDAALVLADEQHKDMPASIENVAKAFRRSRDVSPVPVPVAAEHFHGDGMGGQVAIVWTDRTLQGNGDAALKQQVSKIPFVGADADLSGASRIRSCDLLGKADIAPSRSSMSIADLSLALFGAHGAPLHKLGLASTSDADAGFDQMSTDAGSTDAEVLAERKLAMTTLIKLDKIVGVELVPFHGDVFNLETEGGWFVADGIVTHNCRCSVMPIVKE